MNILDYLDIRIDNISSEEKDFIKKMYKIIFEEKDDDERNLSYLIKDKEDYYKGVYDFMQNFIDTSFITSIDFHEEKIKDIIEYIEKSFISDDKEKFSKKKLSKAIVYIMNDIPDFILNPSDRLIYLRRLSDIDHELKGRGIIKDDYIEKYRKILQDVKIKLEKLIE